MPKINNSRLDSEFTDWLEQYVDQMLQLHKMARPSPRTVDVWKCKNLGDFMCGFFVGQTIGAATSVFSARYGRDLSADEHAQIADVVEKQSSQIRDIFLKYN